MNPRDLYQLTDEGRRIAYHKLMGVVEDARRLWRDLLLTYVVNQRVRRKLGVPTFDELWTKSQEQALFKLQTVAHLVDGYARDVQQGLRDLLWDKGNDELVVAGRKGETALAQTDKDTLVLTDDAPEGEVKQEASQGALEQGPALGAGVVVAIVVAALSSIVAFASAVKLSLEALRTLRMREATRYLDQCQQQGKTQAECDASWKAIVEGEEKIVRASAEADVKSPAAPFFDTLQTAVWAMLALGAVGAVGYAVVRYGPGLVERSRPRRLAEAA